MIFLVCEILRKFDIDSLYICPPYLYTVATLLWEIQTRSSATAQSTARPSCLVGVLCDIYRETNNRSTANQPLVRNWP